MDVSLLWKKDRFRIINGALFALIILLGVLMMYLAGKRDFSTSFAWIEDKKKEDLLLRNMEDINDILYENGKLKIDLYPRERLFNNLWRGYVPFNQEMLMLFVRNDKIHILDVKDKTLDIYTKNEYAKHITSRLSNIFISNPFFSTDAIRRDFIMLLEDLFLKDRVIDTDAPMLDGCIIIPTDKSEREFELISRSHVFRVNVSRHFVVENTFPKEG